MAEPDSSDSLPTQPWSGPASSPPGVSPNPAPSPAYSAPRRGGWQPPEPEQLQPSFPQYEIRSILGRGGMGAVYQGWQKSLRRLVAIKILPPGLEDDGANFAERFQREAQAMARFSHPGIVAVFDAGETPDGLLYFVMEYIEGTDVQKMVKTQGPLSPEHALAITAHVCDALAYAHKRGVIHRDIKPANIMVDAEGSVKVADFGLAKVANDDSAAMVTGSHVSMGTMDFMAPEALYGMKQVDQRADLYAVGVMLYQMLTGEVPRGMFDPPSVHRPGIDARFDAIVARAMQKDPEKRYSSATDIRTDLDRILTQPIPHRSAVQDVPPPSAAPQAAVRAEVSPAPPAARKAATSPAGGAPRSRRWVYLSSGIAATLALLAGGAILFHDKPAQQLDSAAAPSPGATPTPEAIIAAPLTPLANEGWRPLVSAAEWQREDRYRDHADGLLHLRSGLSSFQPTPDGAIRARIHLREKTKVAGLTMRMQERGKYELALQEESPTGSPNGWPGIALSFVQGPTINVPLKEYRFPKPLRLGDQVLLELRAEGKRLTAMVDGVVVIDVEDDRLVEKGSWGASPMGWFEFVEVHPLPLPAATASSSAPLEPGAIKLWNNPEKFAGSKTGRWENNAMRLENGGTPPVSIKSTDGLLRANIRRNADAGETQLSLRVSDGNYYRLTFHFTNIEIFRVIKGSGAQIAQWPLPQPRRQGPDEWPLVEFKAVGNSLTATVDGQHVGTILDDAIPGPGSVTAYCTGVGYFRDVVYLPLDPAGKPGSSSRAPAPAEKWQDARPALGISGGFPTDRSNLTIPRQGIWTVRSGPQGDAAIRIRIPFTPEIRDLKLLLRRKGNTHYQANFFADGANAQIQRYDGSEYLPLSTRQTIKLSSPLKSGDPLELDFRVVGQKLTFRANGRLLVEGEDAHLATGDAGVNWSRNEPVVLDSVEFADLANSNQAPLVGIPPIGKSVPNAAPSPTSEVRIFNGHRYQFVPGSLAWSAARDKAAEMGGHLAIIDNSAEHEWALSFLAPILNKLYDCCWIGASSEIKEKAWKWVDGTSLNFTAWGKGQPNYVSPVATDQRYYLGYVFANGTLAWNDVGESEISAKASQRGFLVEWDDANANASPANSTSAAAIDIPPLNTAPPITLPSTGWKPFVADLNQLTTRPGVELLPDGWVRLTTAYLQAPPLPHVALRARIRFNGVESWMLKVRESGPNAVEAYTVAVAADGSKLILAMRDAANPTPKVLATARLPRALTLGHDYSLALAVQGSRLSAFFDNQPLIEWLDASLTGTDATVGSSKSMVFKDAEWVALPPPAAPANASPTPVALVGGRDAGGGWQVAGIGGFKPIRPMFTNGMVQLRLRRTDTSKCDIVALEPQKIEARLWPRDVSLHQWRGNGTVPNAPHIDFSEPLVSGSEGVFQLAWIDDEVHAWWNGARVGNRALDRTNGAPQMIVIRTDSQPQETWFKDASTLSLDGLSAEAALQRAEALATASLRPTPTR